MQQRVLETLIPQEVEGPLGESAEVMVRLWRDALTRRAVVPSDTARQGADAAPRPARVRYTYD